MSSNDTDADANMILIYNQKNFQLFRWYKKSQYEKMKYMGQEKYLSNESQIQSRCVLNSNSFFFLPLYCFHDNLDLIC